MRGISALLVSAVVFTAAAGTRLRIEEGGRLRQTRLSSSYEHTCAVLDDGTVRCWGNNADGELGDGTNATPKTSPVQASGVVNIVSISAGYDHTCALHSFGAVFCWGANAYGQLGNGTKNPSFTAVQVQNLDNVTAVAAGGQFTCALRANGTVWCWGRGDSGQMGNGTSGTSGGALTPVQVHLASPAFAITAGESHACAVVFDTSSSNLGAIAQCWGSDTVGQLGDGGQRTFRSLPVQPGVTGVVDIAAGELHTCALLITSSVSCWGSNAGGQVGNGSISSVVSAPAAVVTNTALAPLTGVAAIAAGSRHSCALLARDGAIQCWGDDTYGQLGDSKTNNTRPFAGTAVSGSNSFPFEIVTGLRHTCVVGAEGFTGSCWGDNSSGQLGNATTTPSSVPVIVHGVPGSTGLGARSIRANDSWSCAKRGGGGVSCWGGIGTNPAGPNPIAITTPNFPLNDYLTLATSPTSTCLLEAAHYVDCFDDNVRQLENVAAGDLMGVSMGNVHKCFWSTTGPVSCAGSNSRGQLGGPGSQIALVVDATNQQLFGAVMVVSGAFHSCALLYDGTVWCWGDNSAGQLGIGSVGGFNNFAVQVPGLSNIIAITAGLDPGSGGLGTGSFNCALSATGSVSCWGASGKGQIGNGSTVPTQSVAQLVFGLNNAAAIAAGGSHACAVLGDGSAVCWGDDSRDQLGAADTAPVHTTPVPVIQNFTTVNGVRIAIRLSFLTAIAPGLTHTCSLQSSGQPRCWGDDSAGEIGDGTISSQPQPRPTIVNSFTANVQPAVSLKTNGRIAIVTALINCPAGGEAHISLTLEQGRNTGSGDAVSKCEGGLVEVPMTVPAQGTAGFHAGAATAKVEALVKDRGDVTEDQHWTRAVVLSIQP